MIAPTLLYHKIDFPSPDSLVRGGFTPPKRFAKQLGHLKKQGFVFYSASELIEFFNEEGKFPPRGICLTLDDGWRDNYSHAFPILKELGIKATIFVVPSCIDQSSTKALYQGEGPREHLTKDQILEMAQHGIEFASHTLNHRQLHKIPLEEVRTEVVEAKKEIENLLQQPCKVFAYPAGFFNQDVKRIVAEAGHIAAFTTVYGPTDEIDLFALNRVEILRRDRFLFQFSKKLKLLE